MKRSGFIQYLTDNGCLIIREDKAGYCVIRNVINAKMSGVPENDPLRLATVCRICKTLEIEPPDEARSAAEIVDFIHDQHSKK